MVQFISWFSVFCVHVYILIGLLCVVDCSALLCRLIIKGKKGKECILNLCISCLF